MTLLPVHVQAGVRRSVQSLRQSSRLFQKTTIHSNEHTKVYRLQGIGRRSQVEMTTDTGHTIKTDVPKTMGGQDMAPQPVETLLAALLGCTQATAIFVGRHCEPRILIDRIEFDIAAERNERGALELPIAVDPQIPARLQRISGTVTVYTKDKNKQQQPLSQEQLHVLSHQTELRCPVANMIVASGCEMNVTWVDGTALRNDAS
jgi:uncharacterized OsmC-like protein